MITQRRRTAGIRIISEDLNLHLDPGPGALVHSIEGGLDPQRVRALLVSHCHPDHYADAEVFVEAMTRGMTRKQGLLAAPRSVLEGSDVCEASISKYHQQIVAQKIVAEPRVEFESRRTQSSGNRGEALRPRCSRLQVSDRFWRLRLYSNTEYLSVPNP